MRTIIIFYILCMCASAKAQPGSWTWIRGDSANRSGPVFSHGNIGPKGVSLPTNNPPGRYACAQWTDTAGNFWIYGSSLQSDLWKFNINTEEWTWMHGTIGLYDTPVIHSPLGIFDSLNTPGNISYGPYSWVDDNNFLWLYGGSQFARQSADLWVYNPAINQWAWKGTGPGQEKLANWGTKGLAASSNHPGNRNEGTASWYYDNCLWFFGGNHLNSTGTRSYNDVWKYDIGANLWTWVSGTTTPNDTGNYGPIGVPSVNYLPAARAVSMIWQDDDGFFWLSGGRHWSDMVIYNDIWKFNPRTLEWTRVRGEREPSTISANALCDTADENEAGSRYENRAVWKLSDEAVITYGGVLFQSTMRSDLWCYLPKKNSWLQIGEWLDAGNYGIQGISSNDNYPPFRSGAVGFKGRDCSIWLFSGMYFNGIISGYVNDMWRYTIDRSCLPVSYNSCGSIVTKLENAITSEFTAYPNPNNNSTWNIELPLEWLYSDCAVVDVTGRVVLKSELSHLPFTVTFEAARGVYFLHLQNKENHASIKLVKW